MDQDARATTREGRQGPSTTPAAASKTERESQRNRTRYGTRAAPKNRSNGRQSTTQKLPQHRSTPQRGKTAGAGTRDAQTAPQFQPPDNGNDTPGRTEPTDETHRAETRKPTQTEHEATANGHRSDQTDDANTRLQTNRQGHSEPHQRAPGHAPGQRHGGHPPQQNQKTETPDAQDTRPPKESKHKRQRSKETEPTPQRNRTTRTTNGREPRRAGATNRGDKRHKHHRATKSTKNTNMAKNRKTRAKKMVVGGKLLRGRKLQARKRPFEPDQRARRPKRRDEDEARRR